MIGDFADFCNRNGEVMVTKVLKGLAKSEKAVLNRQNTLSLRLQSENLTNEISSKFERPSQEID